jgi:multidrug efflux pump subunit AcrA (membrane-fusion protein)
MEFERAKRNLQRMVVKAPISGLVVMLMTHRGAEHVPIQEGDQIWPGQPYMQVVDCRSMVVNAILNQVDVDQLRLGVPARISFDAYPGLELPGTVVSIGSYARSGGFRGAFVKELPVRLKLDQTDPRVIPDLSVSADLLLEKEDDATYVPREAVFSGEGEKTFAFVKNATGWEKRELELGLASHTFVNVTAGVNEGEIVAAERPPEQQTAGVQ